MDLILQINEEKMRELEDLVNVSLDVSGETCPYPALKMLEAMEQLESGEVLELLSDCMQSINNVPYDAKNHGYKLLGYFQSGPLIRFFVQK